jgi:hypothetical protein
MAPAGPNLPSACDAPSKRISSTFAVTGCSRSSSQSTSGRQGTGNGRRKAGNSHRHSEDGHLPRDQPISRMPAEDLLNLYQPSRCFASGKTGVEAIFNRIISARVSDTYRSACCGKTVHKTVAAISVLAPESQPEQVLRPCRFKRQSASRFRPRSIANRFHDGFPQCSRVHAG